VVVLTIDVVVCIYGGLQATLAQQVVSCAVRWAAVSPLATDSRDHTLALVGDPEDNPDSLLMFGGSGEPLTEVSSQLTGSLNVTIVVVRSYICLLG